MTTAGEESTATVFHDSKGTKSVVLQLIDPFGTIERLSFSPQRHRLKERHEQSGQSKFEHSSVLRQTKGSAEPQATVWHSPTYGIASNHTGTALSAQDNCKPPNTASGGLFEVAI
jgi:hypothetical protein